MATSNSQESELIIRARDLSSEPIAKIAETVKQLSAALNIQTDAANKGEGSMKGLSLAVSDLDKVLAAVLNQSSKLDAFEKSIQRVADATSGYAEAKANLDAFKASIEGVTKPTAEQESTLKKLQVALSAASKESNSANRQFATQSAAMAKLGVDTNNLTQAQQTNAASLLQVSTAYRQANTAQIDFSANRAKARAEVVAQQKAEADFNAFLKRAADEELARIAAIAKAKSDSYKLDKQVNDSQAALDRQRDAALKTQEAEQAELNRLRKVAQDSLSSTGPSGLGVSPDATQSINSASAALAGILAPAAQARATLAGVSSEVTSLARAADSGEKRTAGLTRSLLETAEQSKRALQTQAQLIDGYRNQERATLAAGAAANTAYAELEKLDKELAAANAPSKELSTQLGKARSDLANATAEYEKQNLSLTRLRQGLNGAGIEYGKLDEASKKINTSAVSLTKTIKTLDASLTEGEKAHSGSGGLAIFGLRPDQLSNVEHELSHAFDQIASGGSPFRAFLEQAGKLLFNFQNGLAALTPYVGALAIALPILAAGLAAVINSMQNEIATRNFTARLAAMGETSVTTGAQLTEYSRQIARTGQSFEEARKAVDLFLAAGISPKYFTDLGGAADKLSTAFGKSFPDAAKTLTAALTDGFTGVQALNKEFSILSGAQIQAIHDAYDQGDANKALTLTYQGIIDGADRTGAELKGPLTRAVIELKNAWNDLLVVLGNSSIITGLISDLTSLADTVNLVLRNIPGLVDAKTAASQRSAIAADRIKEAQKRIDELNAMKAGPDNANGQQNAALDRELAKRQAILANLQEQKAAFDKIAGLQKDGTTATVAEGAAIVTNTNNLDGQAAALATRLREEREGRSDRQLKNDEERRKHDDAVVEALRARLNREAGLLTNNANVQSEINKTVDDEARRLAERRTQLAARDTADQQALALKTAEAQASGLKGAAKIAAEKQVINLKVEQEITRLQTVEGLSREATQEKFATQLTAFRIAEEGKVQRSVDAQGAAAGQRALKAEEGLTQQLLALKEKLDNKDKTDLAARLRGIDEEYAKRELLIEQAKRRGAGTAGTVNLDELQQEVDAAKKKEIENVTLETQEASLNALLKARKEAYAAISEAVKSGAISVNEGFKRASDVTSNLGKQLETLVKDSLQFAKNIGGAAPSPKIQEFITKLESIQKQPQPGNSGNSDATPSVTDNGADKVTQAALERINALSKERNDIESAYRTLQKDGLVDTQTAEDKTKAAYDRTSPLIKQTILDTQTHLDQLKELGQIGPAAYDLATAELVKYGAQAQYASANQKELISGIESSVLNRATAGFESIATAIGKVVAGQGNLKTITAAVGQAFASFAAGILEDIAKIIIKQFALAAISAVVAYLTGGTSTAGGEGAVAGALSAGSAFGAGGAGASPIGDGGAGAAPLSHNGSIVGAGGSGMSRYGLNASAFANAPRFHTGTIVGLASDEQTAIVQNGEEILSKDNPRNIMNGGANTQPAAPAQKGIKQVLVFDQKDLAGALAGSHGEDVTLTHIRNNTAAIRTMLG